LCISIVMDEPKQGYYGGQTAAPVFHDFATAAANYLKIRPDRTNASPVLVGAANSLAGVRSVQSASDKPIRNP
jgi:hypothetical protein